MREGLRSAAKLCNKVKKDQPCNGEKDCDSGIGEETFIFSSNQDVDFGQNGGFRNEGLNCVSSKKDESDLVVEVGSKDGSKCKESGVKISSAEVCSDARKRRRIDGEMVSNELVRKGDCDNGKKVESKEVVNDKIQAAGRVLRSAIKTKSENECNVRRNIVCVSEKQPEGCESADKSVEASEEVSKFNGDFGDPLTSEIEETRKAVVENDQQYNGDMDCDFGTKDDAFFTTLKQDVGACLNDGPNDDDLNHDSGTKEDGSKLVVEVGPKDGFECKESGEIIGTGKVNAVEVITSARKRRIDGETESIMLARKADFNTGKKVDSEEVLDDKIQAVGRVLRSRSAMKTKCENEDNVEQSKEVVSKKQPRRFEDSENENVDLKKEVQSKFNGELSDPSATAIAEKPKPKRGRPPKSLGGNESEKKRVEVRNDCVSKKNSRMTKVKRKRGRPRKVENSDGELPKEKSYQFDGEESDESYGKPKKKPKKKKRGRPRLEKENRKVGLRKNIPKGAKSTYNEGISQVSGKRFVQEESQVGNLICVKKTKCGDIENGGSRIEQTAAGSTLLDKQAVRDKIVELLMGAGWTVQYRPRNGRAYCDSVYVNPEGKTHWSVTLAYRVFKEESDKSGIKFTPIPNEELSMLKRIVSKERSDKNKKKKKRKLEYKDGYAENDEELAKIKRHKRKLQKRKLHKNKSESAGSLRRKILNGRMKVKASRNEHSHSIKDHKRVKVHAKRGFALMARDSKDGDESKSGGYVLYNGKRTVLAWMINLGTVLPNTKVQHFKRRKARILNGRITTDGIQCECCNVTFTISEFESHAGTKTCQPLKNIHLENGTSLLQCQLESWHRQDEHVQRGFHLVNVDGEDPNDDTCGICGDGGSLICCDSCPSTFHQSCLEIENEPSGVWNCMYCLCKICGKVDGNVCQEEDDSAASPTLLPCGLCEEKYHQSCVHVEGNINDDSSNILFCGRSCQELYENLQKLLGVKHELDEGFSWSFVRRFDVSPDISVNGMARKVECNSKVAVALDVMDECFLPMVDHRSGVNLIHNVVYNFGSNFHRLNYSGFLTAILERGDEIIAVASIRIHGNSLAEMPFIGTRHMYRRQGMCRRLLGGIETALCSLHVEKLIIPAIAELRETWTSVFGFMPLEDSVKQKMRNLNLMAFPGVDMLQKPMLGHIEERLISESFMSKPEECQNVDDLPNDSEERCSAGFDLNETGSSPVRKEDSDPTKLELVPVLSDCCLNDTSDITTENLPQAGKTNVEVAAIESGSHVPDDCLRNTNETCCNENCGSGAVESTSLPIDDSSAVTYLDSHHKHSHNQSGTGIALIDINEPSTMDGDFDVMAADHEINPSSNDDGVTSDTIVKSPRRTHESNGHHISEETTSISCEIDLNVENCEVTEIPRRITRASKLLSSNNNEVDIDDVSGGIGMHCSAGGGNGCPATEVVVLSNQAS